METSLVNKHNFEISKSRINDFVNQLPANSDLTKVEEDGFLFFSHKVTGEELNNLTTEIQRRLTNLNSILISTIREFKTVYKTFDFLDTEYLGGILQSLDAAEKASQSAKVASDQATKASEQALEAHKENSKTLEALKATVIQLKKFKQEVLKSKDYVVSGIIKKQVDQQGNELGLLENKISENAKTLSETDEFLAEEISNLEEFQKKIETSKHIYDIDILWSISKKCEQNASDLRKQLDADFSNLSTSIKDIEGEVDFLKKYQKLLDSYKHLADIDVIWELSNNNNSDLAKLHILIANHIDAIRKTTNNISKKISTLEDYKTKQESYKHLPEIDDLWEDSQKQKTELSRLHNQLENLDDAVTASTKAVNENIVSLQEYRRTLEGYKHLLDIDNLWEEVQECVSKLTKLYEQFNTHTIEFTKKTTKIEEEIASLDSYFNQLNQQLTEKEKELKININHKDQQFELYKKRSNKKVLILSIALGGTFAMSLVQLLLILLGIL